jgi:membrane protease YdiL (CAAX protease family)
MQSLANDKDFILVSIIAAIFVAVTLSESVGLLFVGMALCYAFAIGQGKQYAYEFFRGNTKLLKILGIAAVSVGIWFFVSEAFFSVFNISQANSFSVMATSLNLKFTIDSPAIKFLVWGILIPIIETAFILGVVQKFAMRKSRAREKLNDPTTLFICLMIGAFASMLHILVRVMNDTALSVDFIFFALSAALVIQQKGELKVPMFMHIMINSIGMAVLIGWI